MSGPDVRPPSYIKATLPLKIPTEQLDLEDNNIPDRLLQAYLNNYKIPIKSATIGGIDDGSGGMNRVLNLVDESYEQRSTEPINL
jgi:hypothetical protein